MPKIGELVRVGGKTPLKRPTVRKKKKASYKLRLRVYGEEPAFGYLTLLRHEGASGEGCLSGRLTLAKAEELLGVLEALGFPTEREEISLVREE